MPTIPPSNIAEGLQLEKMDDEATVEMEEPGFLGLSKESALAIRVVAAVLIVVLLILSL